MRTTDEALAQLIFDDRHTDWLLELADKLRNTTRENGDSFTARELGLPMECMMQDTEEHTIWLLIIGKFGEWAQCINYGWLEQESLLPCAEWIESICGKEET